MIVTQVLRGRPQDHPVLQIDVDVSRMGEFPVEADELRSTLETLRMVKNRTFFSLLTDEAVRLYL